MEVNIERYFFELDFEGRLLIVYEFWGWFLLMVGKINCCYDDYDNLLLLEKILLDVFFDKLVFKSIMDKEVYDFLFIWENYVWLMDSEKGFGLF